MTEKSELFHDSYGPYRSSIPEPPVPPFPCTVNDKCTAENRLCDRHKRILFVKMFSNGEIFEIPYGHWENWLWYKERINDCRGIPVDNMRLIYAGCERNDFTRHSGLQYQSTIHLVLRQPTPNESNERK